MEPVLIILVPGLLGGVVLALMIARFGLGARSDGRTGRLTPPSPSMINMATIRVEGIGGLGLVAAVVVVAITDPRIRLAMIIALVLGVALAVILIGLRRRTGSASGGAAPGAHSMLGIDAEQRRRPKAISHPGARAELAPAGLGHIR